MFTVKIITRADIYSNSCYNNTMRSIYCSNCGKLINERSNFCKFCGATQHGVEASVYRASRMKTVVRAAGALALSSEPIIKNKKTKKSTKPNKVEAKDTDDDDEDQHLTKYDAKILHRRKLSPRVKWSFVISYVLTTYIILIPIAIGMLFDPFLFTIVLVAYIFVLYLAAAIAYNQFFYQVDEDGFQKEYGVLYKNQAAIPYSKIQNVNITRSITDRMLGLARIDIETAGSNSNRSKLIVGGSMSKAEGHLPGLTLQRAKQVHDILLHNAVVYTQPNGT